MVHVRSSLVPLFLVLKVPDRTCGRAVNSPHDHTRVLPKWYMLYTQFLVPWMTGLEIFLEIQNRILE